MLGPTKAAQAVGVRVGVELEQAYEVWARVYPLIAVSTASTAVTWLSLARSCPDMDAEHWEEGSRVTWCHRMDRAAGSIPWWSIL